jgi:hypothetical protein
MLPLTSFLPSKNSIPTTLPEEEAPLSPMLEKLSLIRSTVQTKTASLFSVEEPPFSSMLKKLSFIGSTVQQKTAPLFSTAKIEWTDIKITQVFLSAISGYALIGARTVAGGFLPTTISSFAAATPFVCLSLTLLWYSASLIDYENPETRGRIQKTCEKLPLSRILVKHRLEDIFNFELLDSKTFASAYRMHAETLSFQGILNLNKEANHALYHTQTTSSYQIPHPSEWKHKFFQETKNLSPDQILCNYAIYDLQSFEILSSEQISILKAISDTLDQKRQTSDTHLKKLSSLIEEEMDQTLEKYELLKNAKSHLSLSSSCSPDGIGKEFESKFTLESEEYRAIKEKTDASLETLYKSYRHLETVYELRT